MKDIDTIAAISTPIGVGGIAVIRISGSDSITIANALCCLNSGKKIIDMSGGTCAYVKIFSKEDLQLYICRNCKNILPIDEGIISVFRAPLSYTGENVVEISCHGGNFVTAKVLRAVLNAGARLADPGEFTKRALLNGKINLLQAESIAEIIAAQSEHAQKSAVSVRQGALGDRLNNIISSLKHLIASLAVWNDFPDEDIPGLTIGEILATLQSIDNNLEEMIQQYDQGKVWKQGVKTVIAGGVNVGKSSIMNCLSGYDKSIVTDIPGTTRDIVEESIKMGDVPLIISDTAGIRDTDDYVESIGVQRSLEKISDADLVLYVVDVSANGVEISKSDLDVINQYTNLSKVVLLWNKVDKFVGEKEKLTYFNNQFQIKFDLEQIFFSALDGTGVTELRETVNKLFLCGKIDINAGVLANERQLNCIASCKTNIESAILELNSGISYDLITVILEDALSALLVLTGESVSDAVLNEVFSKFCVGK